MESTTWQEFLCTLNWRIRAFPTSLEFPSVIKPAEPWAPNYSLKRRATAELSPRQLVFFKLSSSWEKNMNISVSGLTDEKWSKPFNHTKILLLCCIIWDELRFVVWTFAGRNKDLGKIIQLWWKKESTLNLEIILGMTFSTSFKINKKQAEQN